MALIKATSIRMALGGTGGTETFAFISLTISRARSMAIRLVPQRVQNFWLLEFSAPQSGQNILFPSSRVCNLDLKTLYQCDQIESIIGRTILQNALRSPSEIVFESLTQFSAYRRNNRKTDFPAYRQKIQKSCAR